MLMNDRLYFGKLMLLGEYTVITGSSALLIPFRRFHGKWQSDANRTPHFKESLQRFVDHLENNQKDFPWLNIRSLKEETKAGWYFYSNIPQGYGAGSSGALVAAVYEQFSFQIEENLIELKKQLAAMESYFHGSSSGLDPLACLLGQPLMIESPENIRIAEVDENVITKNIYLIDSKQTAATAPLVSFFRKQLMEYPFYKKLSGIVIPAVEEAIDAKLSGKEDTFIKAIQRISSFQFENLQPMIPETLRPFWQNGLETKQYSVKLCGSGGGGYFLLCTDNKNLLPDLPEEMKLLEL